MNTISDLRAEFPARTPAGEAPGTRAAREASRPEHYYVGRRARGTDVYVVSSAGTGPLEHHRYRSSAHCEWGTASPGSLELAFAILAHGTESRPPDPICVTFWTEAVACFDRTGFVLGYGDLALWLLTAFSEPR